MQVFQVADERSGCPPAADANSALLTQTITLSETSVIVAQGHMIRNHDGRADLALHVDGSQMDRTLTYTSSGQWEDGAVFWMGTLSAGEHTVQLVEASGHASIWGCQQDWGDLDVLVLPGS